MKHQKHAATALVALAAAAAAPSRDAQAAGFYVGDRGTRPIGRGGAFVAGADDLGAIWYNPAGIVEAPTSVLLDASYVDYSDTYARVARGVSSTGAIYPEQEPTVKGTTPFLPPPTVVGSYRFNKDTMSVAGGVFAPDAALLSYPATVEQNGASVAAPQRYSLISLNGTILAVIGGWFAWKPVEQLEVGAGVQLLTGYFKTTIDFSASPQQGVVASAENPQYDAYSGLSAGPIFAPSANVGATFKPAPIIRFGTSFQAPYVINAPTDVNVRLPNAPEFDGAYQQGTKAHLHIELPPVFRAGAELRPLGNDDLRLELAYVAEFWSVEKTLDITPDNIELYNIKGFPNPFGVTTISVPRGMQNSSSFRFGGEYTLHTKIDIVGRAGVSYETSAIPNGYVTPLTIDNSKIIASLGGSLVLNKHLRLDGAVAHVFQPDVNVPYQSAQVPLINPVRGNPTTPDTVNGGTYHVDVWIFSAGLEYRF